MSASDRVGSSEPMAGGWARAYDWAVSQSPTAGRRTISTALLDLGIACKAPFDEILAVARGHGGWSVALVNLLELELDLAARPYRRQQRSVDVGFCRFWRRNRQVVAYRSGRADDPSGQ